MPKVTTQIVTPEIASQYLESIGGCFRKPNESVVNRYANEIRNGNWEFNGEAIKFSNGRLIDGQHRLLAVIEAKTPIKTLVITELTNNGEMLDRGRRRNTAQWLRHRGYTNTQELVTTTRHILNYKLGTWSVAKNSIFNNISDFEVVEFVEKEHEKLYECLAQCNSCKKIVPKTQLAAVIYIGTTDVTVNHELVKTFVHGLSTGLGLSEKDPVYWLRRKLENSRSLKSINQFAKKTLLTIAWNKTVLGEAMSVRHSYNVDNAPNTIELIKSEDK